MRFIAVFILACVFTLSFSVSAEDSRVPMPELRWPTFPELNHAVTAKAIRYSDGIRLEYKVSGQSLVRRVPVPADLWARMKTDFKPRQAEVVLSSSGQISSIEVKESRRELWITFDRDAASGRCLEMVYPSGHGIENLGLNPAVDCGS